VRRSRRFSTGIIRVSFRREYMQTLLCFYVNVNVKFSFEAAINLQLSEEAEFLNCYQNRVRQQVLVMQRERNAGKDIGNARIE
jgi:hypothetical protein